MLNRWPLAVLLLAALLCFLNGWHATALLLYVAAYRWIWLRPTLPPPTASALVESELMFEPVRIRKPPFDPTRRHLDR